MPRYYREQRLEHAVIRVSGESIPGKNLYACLWETLEAVIAADKTAGASSLQKKGDGFA